jgi:7-cyano-7-deazaguanine synthase
MPKAVMSLSGGMDSTTLLKWFLDHGYDVTCLHFQYGSKHNSFEFNAITKIVEHFKVPFQVVDLTRIMSCFTSNLLSGQGDIPEGHYSDASMSKTVVPGRNSIFLAISAGMAESIGAEKIGIGVHLGDHAIYPDCRREFVKAMDSALYLGTGGKVEIIAPFQETDKSGILEYGLAHDVPYELTRTCYKEQEVSCAKCGSCVERREAFRSKGVVDPIPYEEPWEFVGY